MEFIYLVPGNWFELKNINKEKVCPYDIDMLKNEIINQITSRSDKLSFINLTFGSSHTKTEENIEFYLSDEKFQSMIKILESESRHPIITFHGTTYQAVQSILENGYVVPGLNDTKTDVIVKRTHGAAYGIGVYTSPFFDKAMQYTTTHNDKCVYILINMLFPGKIKLIPPGGIGTDFKKPINGTYADGSNTRIVYGLEQIITADAGKVIPIAVMKISINNPSKYKL
jgi:hypothetical protein